MLIIHTNTNIELLKKLRYHEDVAKSLEQNVLKHYENMCIKFDSSSQHYVLLEFDGNLNNAKVVGYKSFYIMSPNGRCEFFSTFVSENFRKRGIAKKLVLKSFDIVKEKYPNISSILVYIVQPWTLKNLYENLKSKNPELWNIQYNS